VIILYTDHVTNEAVLESFNQKKEFHSVKSNNASRSTAVTYHGTWV